MHIELLAAHHSREGFDCGDPVLNQFLQRLAGQQQPKAWAKPMWLWRTMA